MRFIKFKCSLNTPKWFYQSANAIFGKVGKSALGCCCPIRLGAGQTPQCQLTQGQIQADQKCDGPEPCYVVASDE